MDQIATPIEGGQKFFDDFRGAQRGLLFFAVRIFYIQIEALLQILDLHLPRDVAFLAFVPPLDERRELAELDPFMLRENIEGKLRKIWKLQKVKESKHAA
jgi:hypothetical protein